MRKGIVTLAGQLGSAEQHGLIRIAVRLAWNMDGVVDVVNKLGVSITPSIPSARPAIQRHAGVCQDNKLQPHTPLNPQEFVAGQGQDRTVDLPLTGKSHLLWARGSWPWLVRAVRAGEVGDGGVRQAAPRLGAVVTSRPRASSWRMWLRILRCLSMWVCLRLTERLLTSQRRFAEKMGRANQAAVQQGGRSGVASCRHQPQDHRSEDQLHRELHLAARHDDDVGP